MARARVSGSSTYALNFGGQGDNNANVELGFRQRGDFVLDRVWTVKLSDRLAWLHNWSGTPNADAAFQALPNSTFTTYGAKDAKNGLLMSVGADLAAPQWLRLHRPCRQPAVQHRADLYRHGRAELPLVEILPEETMA